jgi:hypothetical protein
VVRLGLRSGSRRRTRNYESFCQVEGSLEGRTRSAGINVVIIGSDILAAAIGVGGPETGISVTSFLNLELLTN